MHHWNEQMTLHEYLAFLSYENNIFDTEHLSSAINSTVISLHFHPLDPARKMRSAHWETVFWWVTEVREKVTWCDGLLSKACKSINSFLFQTSSSFWWRQRCMWEHSYSSQVAADMHLICLFPLSILNEILPFYCFRGSRAHESTCTRGYF